MRTEMFIEKGIYELLNWGDPWTVKPIMYSKSLHGIFVLLEIMANSLALTKSINISHHLVMLFANDLKEEGFTPLCLTLIN